MNSENRLEINIRKTEILKQFKGWKDASYNSHIYYITNILKVSLGREPSHVSSTNIVVDSEIYSGKNIVVGAYLHKQIVADEEF
jgi:hypothetical protein